MRVGPLERYYVDQASSNAVFPYGSWGTAATNIQDAIAAGTQAGRLVLVSNGVYRTGILTAKGTNRIALTNAVTVQSVNGPEVTLIEGATNGVRCVYAGSGSVLSGFTLTNGTALGGWPEGTAGGAWCEPFAVVTNCVLIANSAEYESGGTFGATLYNSTLSGNSSPSNGGGLMSAHYITAR